MTATTMTPKDVLIAAKALIDTPEKWWDGSYPRPNGKQCAQGAICSTSPKDRCATWAKATDRLAMYMDGSVIRFNDSHTHTDVIDAFDRAIAAAES